MPFPRYANSMPNDFDDADEEKDDGDDEHFISFLGHDHDHEDHYYHDNDYDDDRHFIAMGFPFLVCRSAQR